MKKTVKSLLAVLLCASLCFLTASAMGQDDGGTTRVERGYCNTYEKIEWEFKTVSGSDLLCIQPVKDSSFSTNPAYSVMADYELSGGVSTAPWFLLSSQEGDWLIDVLKVQRGITVIGEYSFTNQTNLTAAYFYPTLTTVKSNAFSGCSALSDVYFYGTEEQWNSITINSGNEPLLSATVHFVTVEITVGDLNSDGEVTDQDAIYLLFHTFFPEDYPVDQDCDFDNSGKVTDQDAIYLLFHTFFPEDYPI